MIQLRGDGLGFGLGAEPAGGCQPPTTFFDVGTNTCECPPGLIFNAATDQCDAPPSSGRLLLRAEKSVFTQQQKERIAPGTDVTTTTFFPPGKPWYKTPVGIALIVVGALGFYKFVLAPKAKPKAA